MKHLNWLALFAALLLIGACGTQDVAGPDAANEFPPAPEGEGETIFANSQAATLNIVEIAIANGFNTLVAAVQAAELVDTLANGGPFTVFAPTDEAFAALPAGLVDALLLEENKGKLQQLLSYHVVSGAVKSRDLRFFQRVETLEGSELEILRFFRLIKVDDARVTLADVLATNGVVHVIDEVLIPDGFTLEDPELDIVDTAIAGGFDTLVAAVGAAGLVDALRSEGPFTVFAPSEDAFAALPEGLVAELLLEENRDALVDLLLYHVVDGRVLRGDLRSWQLVKMKNERYTLVRKRSSGELLINRSSVVAADVLATNGAIHVIDRVLIPLSLYGRLAALPDQPPADHPELAPQPEGVNR